MLALASAWLPGLAAQSEPKFERIEFRVSASNADGTILIDRGRADGLRDGDRVFLYPRAGRTLQGTALQVDERSTIVELNNSQAQVEIGTRGDARVPAERFEEPEEPVMLEHPQPPPKDVPEHPPWKETDEQFTSDMPLLAQVRSVPPSERATIFQGRIYSIGRWNSAGSGRQDWLYRAGADLSYDNPFGRGGTLNIDGELNGRDFNLRGNNDDQDTTLRFDRFSYRVGGDRFDPERWEFGRFLQRGMPEFGVVDGIEWNQRTESGDTFGASAGFMPEPNIDYDTGEDLQVAAFYNLVAGSDEQFNLAAGFQKTYHNGKSDRDLLVTKLHYFPEEGWDFHGTAWVDFYGSDDVNKPNVELTQAVVSSGRRWDSGNGINATYVLMRFPELLRNEFMPVGNDALANDHAERLAVEGWRWMGETRVHSEIGGWLDEDDEGGDAEVGFDVRDVFLERSRLDLTFFGTVGRFSTSVGTRLTYGRFLDRGRWDIFYEAVNFRNHDFSPNVDEVMQQRARASRGFYTESGWDVAIFAEGNLWDDELAYTLGFHLQKNL